MVQSATDRTRFLADLVAIVGRRYVLTGETATRRYRRGIRFGSGPAVAVVRPGSLLEMWQTLHACVAANRIVIVQAANTGLTGGSTPNGEDYDREIVIVSTRRVAGVMLLKNGRQVLCLPGATLFQLERELQKVGREPHSVIGSSCIGASVCGGIANNSGGALLQRGPAFTQMALFAQVGEDGEVTLVNHLGIRLGDDPETILRRLEAGAFTPEDIVDDAGRACSDSNYLGHVRAIDADTPARFNADPQRLFEASGAAGKVMLLAARLDTFAKDEESTDFYIGTNDPEELTALRRHMLGTFAELPAQAEYIHRDAFDIAERYGKDTFLAVRHLGTARLPLLFAFKDWLDGFCAKVRFLPSNASDRLLQAVTGLFPRHLPARLYEFRDRFEHHLVLRMNGGGIGEARRYLASAFPSATGDFFECTCDEGRKAFLHRFAMAGAATRYRAVHREEVADLVALDIALPRNERRWVEELPPTIADKLVHRLYYGHFFCHVFHQDYLVKRGADPIEIEHAMWAILDERGAEYPAEHNVGHLYPAKPALVRHYRSLDPTNSLNPRIGQTSKCRHWGEDGEGPPAAS
ncbi:D-lactate dehydrogenase [Sphingomonas aracearum]|uniref:Quinone-dependent D-lactate dehydrogenase n=1 Tax=Sphingomonas aracearum TaxID=2283317 RepID=A0A369VVM6_9SPHN|nr:D-lactate dehydrogenase [Sphingomonas aracearum]RDE06444.1 D-lactate dehydrogenase [Sphingomonas aracearum]